MMICGRHAKNDVRGSMNLWVDAQLFLFLRGEKGLLMMVTKTKYNFLLPSNIFQCSGEWTSMNTSIINIHISLISYNILCKSRYQGFDPLRHVAMTMGFSYGLWGQSLKANTYQFGWTAYVHFSVDIGMFNATNHALDPCPFLVVLGKTSSNRITKKKRGPTARPRTVKLKQYLEQSKIWPWLPVNVRQAEISFFLGQHQVWEVPEMSCSHSTCNGFRSGWDCQHPQQNIRLEPVMRCSGRC